MNKQIEEMARLMCANYDEEGEKCGDGCKCDFDCYAFREAERLWDAGCRKQRDGEWIIIPDIRPERLASYRHICVLCGYTRRSVIPRGSKFCPECCAKMKGGE